MQEWDAEGRKKLAGYMLRAPLALEKMTYDAATGTVIYRSKMHAGLKRNFQLMPGAEWLELLCRHIPDRYEHLVRYVGWYSKGHWQRGGNGAPDQDVVTWCVIGAIELRCPTTPFLALPALNGTTEELTNDSR